MKTFKYTLYAKGSCETDILQQQNELSKKLDGIFTIPTIEAITHLNFGDEGLQMRQDIYITAPNGFTKKAIYTIMNSIKPQKLVFI